MKFFLDTYALIELAIGNSKYAKYVNEELYTSVFNLFELYYVLLRDYNEELAKEMYYKFYAFLVQIKDEWIFLACKFKLGERKREFSYVDALGYVIARETGMKFLSGDKQFEKLENVEFVSKA